MAGLSAFRCPDCRKLVLTSDRGEVQVVLPAQGIGNDRQGNPGVRCICGTVSFWVKEPAGSGR